MYLIDDGQGSAVAVHAGIRDHLVTRLHADRIDAELAQGASPDATISFALRSRALTSSRSRRILANGLLRAMAQAEAPWSALSTGAPVNRADIASAGPQIMELHRLLLADGPVSARGVAQTRILLTTGAGPLYSRPTVASLGTCLRRAIEAMNILDDAFGVSRL
jgi:hypothetical protein